MTELTHMVKSGPAVLDLTNPAGSVAACSEAELTDRATEDPELVTCPRCARHMKEDDHGS